MAVDTLNTEEITSTRPSRGPGKLGLGFSAGDLGLGWYMGTINMPGRKTIPIGWRAPKFIETHIL